MPIEIGTTNVANIKLGGTNIEKVYAGTNLVWERLNYIEMLLDTSSMVGLSETVTTANLKIGIRNDTETSYIINDGVLTVIDTSSTGGCTDSSTTNATIPIPIQNAIVNLKIFGKGILNIGPCSANINDQSFMAASLITRFNNSLITIMSKAYSKFWNIKQTYDIIFPKTIQYIDSIAGAANVENYTFTWKASKLLKLSCQYTLSSDKKWYKNAVKDGNGYVWVINNVAIASCPDLTSSYTGVLVFTSQVHEISDSLLHLQNKNAKISGLTFSEGLLKIGYDAFNLEIEMTTELIIPSTVQEIGGLAFANNTYPKITFLQPSGMKLSLPTPGMAGMLYSKSARTIPIYTDNEDIASYNFSGDNVTTTVVHLDGSAWNEAISTPTASVNANILTLSGSNAEYYEIRYYTNDYNKQFQPIYTFFEPDGRYYTDSTILNLLNIPNINLYYYKQESSKLAIIGRKNNYKNSGSVEVTWKYTLGE